MSNRLSSGRSAGPTVPEGHDHESKAPDAVETALIKAGALTGNGALTAMGAASNAARGGSRWMGLAARKAVGMALHAGAKVAGLTGMGTAAGTGVAVGGFGVIMALVLSLVGSTLSPNIARREALDQLCSALTEKGPADASAGAGVGVDANAGMEEQAKQVYSVLHYAGMNDQNIAGILGNLQTESGIDPTSIQGIFNEPYQIGPTKQAKLDAGGFSGNSTGLGLGQWTGPRAQSLLDYAKAKNGNWYDVKIQLAFALSDDSGSPVLQKMLANQNEGADDPGDAAYYYMSEWERPADHAPGGANDVTRRAQAGAWYAKMSSWSGSADTSLGASVLALAGTTKRVADTKALAAELLDCPKLGEDAADGGGGNSDAAVAMVTFAWPFYAEAAGNDGTDLYKYLHDQVYPGDVYYASCDRSVGTAIRWSGTDDSFPAGPVTAQLAYVNGEGASKWKHVGTFPSSVPETDLKPGDIMIEPGANHIRMYVGAEAVKKVWSDEKDHEPGALYAQGSLNDHSPGLQGPGDAGPYEIYRNIRKEEHSKFSDLKAPADMPPGKGDQHAPTTTP